MFYIVLINYKLKKKKINKLLCKDDNKMKIQEKKKLFIKFSTYSIKQKYYLFKIIINF